MRSGGRAVNQDWKVPVTATWVELTFARVCRCWVDRVCRDDEVSKGEQDASPATAPVAVEDNVSEPGVLGAVCRLSGFKLCILSWLTGSCWSGSLER